MKQKNVFDFSTNAAQIKEQIIVTVPIKPFNALLIHSISIVTSWTELVVVSDLTLSMNFHQLLSAVAVTRVIGSECLFYGPCHTCSNRDRLASSPEVHFMIYGFHFSCPGLFSTSSSSAAAPLHLLLLLVYQPYCVSFLTSLGPTWCTVAVGR